SPYSLPSSSSSSQLFPYLLFFLPISRHKPKKETLNYFQIKLLPYLPFNVAAISIHPEATAVQSFGAESLRRSYHPSYRHRSLLRRSHVLATVLRYLQVHVAVAVEEIHHRRRPSRRICHASSSGKG
ncbi:hypothetical protein LINPERPRIM_LOCUS87, partial [Linum perenne]